MKAKPTKAEADYGKGLPQAHCGICKHFTAPSHCSVIQDPVAPEMWCKYFARIGSKTKFGSLAMD